MILFKQLVTADTKYSFANQPNCVVFDVHNDTPYNMGVSFGKDTGPGNADYFTSPHSVLPSIGPKGNAPSLNNARWNGTIYIYTETPLGTGATNLGSSPAFQITMIGYPAGYQPIGTTSLSRMTATPNTVSTSMGAATSLKNDGNINNTNFIEVTVGTELASTVTFSTYGVLTVGNAGHQGQFIADGTGLCLSLQGSMSSDGGSIVSNGLGQLTVGALKLIVGSLTRIVQSGPFTVTSAGTVCAHGLGVVPDMIFPIADTAGATSSWSVNRGLTDATNTTVYSSQAGGIRTFLLSIKF